MIVAFSYHKLDEGTKAFDEYLKNGKLLMNDPLFSSTPLGKLESIILDPKNALLKDIDDQGEVVDQCYAARIKNLDFSSTFIALICPSYVGKTQSAFALSKVRPLYFPIDQYDDRFIAQRIYLNFQSLAVHLSRYSRIDLCTIDNRIEELSLIDDISVESLLRDHVDVSFMVLGFFAHLIDDAEANFNADSGRAWMDFYVNRKGRPSNVCIEPITISKFKEKLEKSAKYCLFLDEFGDSVWLALVRNLGRCVGLRCVVSCTSTKIASFTGKPNLTFDDNTAWCIVINKLNSSNSSIISSVIDWNNMKRVLLENLTLAANEKAAFETFISDSTEKIAQMRPGILIQLAKNLDSLKDDKSGFNELKCTFSEFLETVIRGLKRKVTMQKFGLSGFDGSMGTIGLMTEIPYDKSIGDNCNNSFNRSVFLRHHLYYLINPVSEESFNFITLLGSGGLDIVTKEGTLKPWKIERTYFNPEDILTIFMCLRIRFDQPVSTILKEYRALEKIGNGSNRESLNPLSLEFTSAASIVFSSHADEFDLEFDSQSGVIFLKNLILNLIDAELYSMRDYKINLKFECDLTLKFLKKVQIPFLLPYNFPSDSIPNILKNLNDCKIVNIRAFKRNSGDERGICSGEFEIDVGSAVTSVAAVEYKNWSEVLDEEGTLNFLKNAILINSSMSLIFCDSTTEFSSECPELKSYCETNFIKLLKIKRAPGTRNFSILEYYPDLKIASPKLYSFIFEINSINLR